jgi:hypothetical protein
MTGETKITSAHIQAALKLRYQPGAHALLFEVANSTGAGQKRFADAVAIGLWPSHGHEVEGVEVKVSRGDWLRERADATKSQEVFQFCDRWWLACPKGMVAVEELPPTWGLLELVGDQLRVKHKAPKLSARSPSMGFVAAMLRRHAGLDEDGSAVTIRREVDRLTRQNEESLRRRFADEAKYRTEQAEDGLKKLAAIKEATGIDLTTWKPAEEWIRAVKFAASDYRKAFTDGGLEGIRKLLRDALAGIDQIPRAGAEAEL